MSSQNGYMYIVDGHRYWLVADVIVSKQRMHLTGTGVYTMDWSYLGYWDRINMPLDLIRSVTAWYKRTHSLEIAERRMAMLRKDRKPKF